MSNSGSTESTPKIPPHPPPTNNNLSDTSSSSPVILPTPSVSSEPEHISIENESRMEASQDQVEVQKTETTPEPESAPVPPPPPPPAPVTAETSTDTASGKKVDVEKVKKATKVAKKSKIKKKTVDSSASDDSDADTESEDSTDDEKEKRKKKRKARAKREAAKKRAAKVRAQKKKKNKRSKKADSSDESSDDSSESSSNSGSTSSSDTDSESAKKKNRRKAVKAKARAKAKKKNKKADSSSSDTDMDSSSSSSSSSSDSDSDSDDVKSKRKSSKGKRKTKTKKPVEDDEAISGGPITITTTDGSAPPIPSDDINTQVTKVTAVLRNLKMQQLAAATAAAGVPPPILPQPPAKKNAHEFKRVDQVWDTKLRDYKLVESTADQKDEFECVFTVRRRFNWEGKLRETLVDIKSKALRGVLQVVLKECKCVSLVEDIPEVDPHILYHYYGEMKKYLKKTLKPKLMRVKKSKDRKQLTQQIAQCKLLLGYIDEDFAATRKALKPLLKAGTITYELCWALFKPNTIVYTPTYGNKEDPRCFKVEQCFEYESWLSGAKSCCIDGKYLEYDGQVFGLGDHQAEIKSFKGHKKITSLVAYPLEYHKDPKVSTTTETQTDYC